MLFLLEDVGESSGLLEEGEQIESESPEEENLSDKENQSPPKQDVESSSDAAKESKKISRAPGVTREVLTEIPAGLDFEELYAEEDAKKTFSLSSLATENKSSSDETIAGPSETEESGPSTEEQRQPADDESPCPVELIASAIKTGDFLKSFDLIRQ